MIDDRTDEEFDRFLSGSLNSRPLPRAGSSLATRARARAAEIRSGGAIQTLARQWRWGLRVNVLAGVVLVAIFTGFVPALLQNAAKDVQAYNGQYDSISAEPGVTDSASSQVTDSLVFGGSILLGAVLLVAVQQSLEGENHSEISFTLAMNSPGREAG